MDTCVFCRIAHGEVTAHIVYEDDVIVAFLDRGAIRRGHLQIIPRQHIPYFDDLPVEIAARILATPQKIARVMKPLYHVERIGFCFTGSDIAHAHAHLVPMHESTDITSRRYIVEENVTFRALPPTPDDMLASCAQELRLALSRTA